MQLRTLTLRLDAMKEATGAQGLRRPEAVKVYRRSEKLTKLDESQVSLFLLAAESARALLTTPVDCAAFSAVVVVETRAL